MKKAEKEVTKQQKQVLEFLKAFYKIRGFTPTLQEIAQGLGLKSRSNVHRLVQELINKGMLTKRPLLARTINIK